MSQPGGPALKFAIQDGVGVITFDQPGSRANTLGQAVLAEWETLLSQLEKQTELRGVVLVSAKPGIFIAGPTSRNWERPTARPRPTGRSSSAGWPSSIASRTYPIPPRR